METQIEKLIPKDCPLGGENCKTCPHWGGVVDDKIFCYAEWEPEGIGK